MISLKQGFYQLGFLLPVIALTFLFAQRSQARFQRYFKTLDPVRAKQLSTSGGSIDDAPNVKSSSSKKFDNSAFVAPALRFHDIEGISSFLRQESSACDDHQGGGRSYCENSKIQIAIGDVATKTQIQKASPDAEKSDVAAATIPRVVCDHGITN